MMSSCDWYRRKCSKSCIVLFNIDCDFVDSIVNCIGGNKLISFS